MQSSNGIQVQIYGQTYHVQGGQDPAYAREVAKLVDEKMNLIATQVHTTDSFRIAVLAALHLADRCLALEHELHSIEGEIADRSEELTALLDEACHEKEAPASMYQAAS
jgi:cell division protein ZapA